MSEKKNRSVWVRILASVSSLAVIFSIVYILIAGVDALSTLVLLAAIGGLTGPAVVAGEGILEIIVGIFEMFLEGIGSILEAIADVFGSLFS